MTDFMQFIRKIASQYLTNIQFSWANNGQPTIHLMVRQNLTNIQMYWANTGLPISNQHMYNGFILVIFWPYTFLPILAQ